MSSLIETVSTEIGEAPPRALWHTTSVSCPTVWLVVRLKRRGSLEGREKGVAYEA
jgi:hypothetical protein